MSVLNLLVFSDLRSRHPRSRASILNFVPENVYIREYVGREPGKSREEPTAADSCSQTAELQSDHCSQQVPSSLSGTSGWLSALSQLGSYWTDPTLRLDIVFKKCITRSERGRRAGDWRDGLTVTIFTELGHNLKSCRSWNVAANNQGTCLLLLQTPQRCQGDGGL